MKAVLLAAGKGTRMGELTRTKPKPLLHVHGKPLLAHILDGMAAVGIREFVVVVGHLGEQIENAFGDGSSRGLSIAYRRQERADGTGGALLLARDLLSGAPFMLSWGDILVDPALYRTMVDRFAAFPCDVLLSVNDVEDPWRGAAVYVGVDGRVQRIVEKPARGSSSTRWNNAGVFIFSPEIFDYAVQLQPSSRGEYELPQAIARMIEDARDVRAVPVGDLWSDIGTPDDLREMEERLAAVPSLPRASRGATSRRETRLDGVVASFRERFGVEPEVIVSAPGRVNLLGEHTDYNGLPVLPMAIDRTVVMAVRARPDARIVLANLDPKFGEREYDVGSELAPYADGDWGNYHKAAVQGLVRHFEERGVAWRGGSFLADGDVPNGAGLSSSSALVVASALAFLAANRREMDRYELAELLALAERYVGTLSGGMDQAASLLARSGHALRIDFFPLRVEPVPLPPDLVVVVCHSLVLAEKSGGAREAYNTRVIECRLACRAMERALGDRLPRPLSRLGDLVTQFRGRPLSSFVDALADRVPAGELTLAQIARLIDIGVDDLRRSCEIPAAMPDRFAVLARARHVLSEADRVDAGVSALAAGDVQEFGRLMVGSHRSCRDDYQVSCPELDELVDLALESGALGARLTGAGFGGCTVNVLRSAEVETFLASVDRGFYQPRLDRAGDPASHRFVLAAREGATVEEVARGT